MPASFLALPPSKPDPIFAIAGKAKAAGPRAINGTIGVYMDETGKPLLFPSVRSAIEDVGGALLDRSYSYPPLLGLPEYRQCVTELLFGKDATLVAGIASTGGTGAVALNLRLALAMDPQITLLLPMPAWANHPPLCRASGIKTAEVPYFADGKPSIEGIAQGLKDAKRSVAVLLQAGCHNPAGLDLSEKQWKELAVLLRTREAIVILDLAYQGFSRGIEEDALPALLLRDTGITTLIAWSASKNHSLYSERTGFACAVVPDEKTQREVEGHYSTITRGIHSASATFGQSVVARVQTAYQAEWRADVAEAREMLKKKRGVLATTLPEDLRAAVAGNGMFAVLSLTPGEIDRLQTEELVFLTGDGRVNIAGIPLDRMEELAAKIGKARG